MPFNCDSKVTRRELEPCVVAIPPYKLWASFLELNYFSGGAAPISRCTLTADGVVVMIIGSALPAFTGVGYILLSPRIGGYMQGIAHCWPIRFQY